MKKLLLLVLLAGCAAQAPEPPPTTPPAPNWPTEKPAPIAASPLDTIPEYPMPYYVEIVAATGQGKDAPHFAPPWFGPADWPGWLAEGERWLTPDGEITHWAAVLDSSGMLMWGVCMLDGGDRWRVIRPWSPSPLNRVYDPCNYIDHLGEPGYPGECNE